MKPLWAQSFLVESGGRFFSQNSLSDGEEVSVLNGFVEFPLDQVVECIQELIDRLALTQIDL